MIIRWHEDIWPHSNLTSQKANRAIALKSTHISKTPTWQFQRKYLWIYTANIWFFFLDLLVTLPLMQPRIQSHLPGCEHISWKSAQEWPHNHQIPAQELLISAHSTPHEKLCLNWFQGVIRDWLFMHTFRNEHKATIFCVSRGSRTR